MPRFDNKTFNKNAAVVLSAQFRKSGNPCDDTGALIDPTTVTLRVIAPDLSQVNHEYDPLLVAAGEIARDGVGLYSCLLSLPSSGEWLYRWEGTGDCQAVDEGKFSVKGSLFVA